jgi:hypothetical protein
MSITLPESAILENPHHISRDIAEARKSFYEMAKPRVVMRSQTEHVAYEKKYLGDEWKPRSAVFVIQTGKSGPEDNPERWVLGLDISVNKDFYGEENDDLIPYALEHEIYEAWLVVKRGTSPKSERERHLLARRRQFIMAEKDGKAERLLAFYKRKNLNFTEELESAYKHAKNRAKNKDKD